MNLRKEFSSRMSVLRSAWSEARTNFGHIMEELSTPDISAMIMLETPRGLVMGMIGYDKHDVTSATWGTFVKTHATSAF